MTYSVEGLLLKNKDPVSEDLMVLLQHSKVEFIQSLFAARSEGAGRSGTLSARPPYKLVPRRARPSCDLGEIEPTRAIR